MKVFPEEIISDNVKEFINAALRAFFGKIGKKHLPVRIEKYRSNGGVERVIRTISHLLAKSNHDDLEGQLTNIVHIYNNSSHRSIECFLKKAFEKFSERVKQLNSEQNKYQRMKQKRQIEKFNKGERVRIAKMKI